MRPPSTYASYLSTLRDRSYVRLDRNRFIPEDKGRLVTTFLSSFFKRYVEYGFTADLDEKLDEVSAGELNWKQLLRDFWKDFSAAVGETKNLKITDVINELDEILSPHIFPVTEEGVDPRKCPTCGDGRLNLSLAASAPSSAARTIRTASSRARSARRTATVAANPSKSAHSQTTGEMITFAQRPLWPLCAAR